MGSNNTSDFSLNKEDFEDFFEYSLSGFIIADAEGKILRANKRLVEWIGFPPEEVVHKRFSDLLSIGGKIYYETHLWPLLRMQGFFDEVALELTCNNNKKLQVLVNALERRNADGEPQFIRLTIFKATDRRLYEENLKNAKAIAEYNLSNALQVSGFREQFIAVLGHDLRNPLGSIIAGASLLSRSQLGETENRVVQLISKSASRMAELIKNVMDFARTRLGEGIILERRPTDMFPVLKHVADELQSMWPGRIIETNIHLDQPIHCDGPRIAQLVSNLLANAITHGSPSDPVIVNANNEDGVFEISVCNSGNEIPEDQIERLFEPFTRESARPSQQGLGLGLYIASQIARAHMGKLTATSTPELTCFTFRMQNQVPQ